MLGRRRHDAATIAQRSRWRGWRCGRRRAQRDREAIALLLGASAVEGRVATRRSPAVGQGAGGVSTGVGYPGRRARRQVLIYAGPACRLGAVAAGDVW